MDRFYHYEPKRDQREERSLGFLWQAQRLHPDPRPNDPVLSRQQHRGYARGLYERRDRHQHDGHLSGEIRLFCARQFGADRTAPNTFGTETRNEFRGPGYANWDFSIFKNTKIREWLNTQFRAEFYNILNHPNLATGSGTISSGSEGTTFAQPNTSWDQASTNPVLGTGGARTIQFGLKLMF
jgi:hypothetical protein